ncbi:hypothetical protein HNR19_001276 [Nocardioides thalensis]|uniref:Septum formation-related domain-containing protein n=1 Tax=Nocardioides thalensis TaxID=1914755 RepID=A0A853C1V2_9ACTN|nr:hypothetical protein [Nocardioides thalensis]NYJ00578.1 hypothetical protein [Nocardioides thalensis]
MSDLTPPGPPQDGPPPPPPPPPGPPPQNPFASAPPPPSGSTAGDTALGWTAFGLAVVCCIPVLPLVAAVLAVVTLVRGRFQPRWLAVLTLVLGLAGTVGQVFLLTNDDFWEGIQDGINDSLEEEAEDARESGEPTQIAPLKLREHDCFNDPNMRTAGDEVIYSDTVTLLPCKDEHDLEVYATFQIPGEDYPGKAAVDRAVQRCFPAFREFVGTSYASSELEIFYYFPTSRSWKLLGDKAITCSVGHPKHRVRGSLEGSKR